MTRVLLVDVFEPVAVRHFDFLQDPLESDLAVVESASRDSSQRVLSPLPARDPDDTPDSESVHSRISRTSRVTNGSAVGAGKISHAASAMSLSSHASHGTTPRPKLVSLKCGHSHSLAQDSRGGVWAWGCNAHGQVVYGVRHNVLRPRQLDLSEHIPGGEK
jgi:hypothetical protein